MSFSDLQQEALALPEKQRASLAAALLNTLSGPDAEIADEEVVQRDEELQSGKVAEVSQDEFVRRVRSERGK